MCCLRPRWAPSFWPLERHSATRHVAVCPGGAGPSVRSGVGLLTWGIVEMALADRCDRDLTVTAACVSGQESIDRGVLLLSAGVPLAFLPVWAVTQRSKVQIQAAGAGLLVRGEF